MDPFSIELCIYNKFSRTGAFGLWIDYKDKILFVDLDDVTEEMYNLKTVMILGDVGGEWLKRISEKAYAMICIAGKGAQVNDYKLLGNHCKVIFDRNRSVGQIVWDWCKGTWSDEIYDGQLTGSRRPWFIDYYADYEKDEFYFEDTRDIVEAMKILGMLEWRGMEQLLESEDPGDDIQRLAEMGFALNICKDRCIEECINKAIFRIINGEKALTVVCDEWLRESIAKILLKRYPVVAVCVYQLNKRKWSIKIYKL